MNISKISIANYRCFGLKTEIFFRPGVNVIIGENNAGKTTVIEALGYLLNRSEKSRPSIDDFNKNIKPSKCSPEILISLTLSSDAHDTLEDKALVATWLTLIEAKWEALLTFSYHLPEENEADFKAAIIKGDNSIGHFWKILKKFQDKYISRIYCGNYKDRRRPDPDDLAKFEMRYLKAIRDVESELYSGSQPMLNKMLQQVLDNNDTEKTKEKKADSFKEDANKLLKALQKRIDTKSLFALVDDVGASMGGYPGLEGDLTEAHLLKALNLVIPGKSSSIPLKQNGLGYNNLIYIALLLQSMEHRASEKLGRNAIAYSILAVEEPEAHLHPALQYSLLKYLSKQKQAKQIFITTHSTHITAGAGLAPIICLQADSSGEITVVYPEKCFKNDKDGQNSKEYIERYLDATKSNMLFSKGVLFVEGIAEQLLIPVLTEYCDNCSLEDSHATVINVGGSTFKHFLPLFGAESNPESTFLKIPVGCIPDGDPKRKVKSGKNPKFKKCYPYQLEVDSSLYEYQGISSVVTNLEDSCTGSSNIKIYHSIKTLEYDLAHGNEECELLVTDSCTNKKSLEEVLKSKELSSDPVSKILEDDVITDLGEISGKDQEKSVFASAYLCSLENAKGSHALQLANSLRANLEKPPEERDSFVVPAYLSDALKWVCGEDVK